MAEEPSNSEGQVGAGNAPMPPLRDWSMAVAVLGPLSWLILPVLTSGGGFGAMAGLYYGLAMVLLWHMTAPLVLIINAVLRHRRGLSLGRGMAFGMCYFMVVDFLAVVMERQPLIILSLLFEKQPHAGPGLFIVKALTVILVISLFRRFRGGFRISGLDDFMTATSMAGLIAIGLAFGILYVSNARYKNKVRYDFAVHIVDMTTRQPMEAVDIEYNDHVMGATKKTTRSNRDGQATIPGWVPPTRITFSKDGYRDEVVWVEGNRGHVAVEEDDGYMTPFRAFLVQAKNGRPQSATVYLCPRKDSCSLPYDFYIDKASKVKLFKSLLGNITYFDPNSWNPDGLPEDVKPRFIAYQAKRMEAEKRFLRTGFPGKPGGPGQGASYLTRQGKATPYHFQKALGFRDEQVEVAIRSLIECEDLDTWLEDYFAFERQVQADMLTERPYRSLGLNSRYVDAKPKSPLVPYVLLAYLHKHRYTVAHLGRYPTSGESSQLNQADFDRFERMSKEALRAKDPLVRYMAKELLQAPDSDFVN